VEVAVVVLPTINELNLIDDKSQIAIKRALNRVADEAVGVAMEQIIGSHRLGTPRSSGKGIVAGRPSNVTGQLRLGMHQVIKRGFAGSYVALVGPSQEYGRYLEEGTGRMRPYKFLAPTAKIMLANGRARNIYVQELRRALN